MARVVTEFLVKECKCPEAEAVFKDLGTVCLLDGLEELVMGVALWLDGDGEDVDVFAMLTEVVEESLVVEVAAATVSCTLGEDDAHGHGGIAPW